KESDTAAASTRSWSRNVRLLGRFRTISSGPPSIAMQRRSRPSGCFTDCDLGQCRRRCWPLVSPKTTVAVALEASMSVSAPSIVPERAVTKTPGAAAPGQKIDLRVGGMTCPHCPPAIEKVLRTTDGVTSAHVNLVNQVARVEYDPSRTKVGDILGA